MKRDEAKLKEIEILAGEYKKNPQLFKKVTYVDDSEFLSKFGIFIKDKEKFPSGYIKLWPQDFIVEEISNDGEIQTIDNESVFSQNKEFSDKDATIYATLVKCGLSTIEAIQELASLLKTPDEQKKPLIQFAGIKDKDAMTSQLISFRGANIENIQQVDSPYFFLKNIYSGKGVIETGGLIGNEFTILVRADDSFSEKQFSENLNKIKEEGFLNFFYLQRFGTPRLINFNWGLSILKGEYEKTVLSFLCSPGEKEQPYFLNLREKIKEKFGDWSEVEKILDLFPVIFQNEKKVVRYLKENPKDFTGALNQIPDQVQLWLFAYASLLFNKKLSYYVKNGIKLPETMPLIISKDKNDWIFYEEYLKEDGILSMPFDNLKPFPNVQWQRRRIPTLEKTRILGYKVIPEGVIIDFILPKAAYATTFLAQLFNLTSGQVPENILTYSVDIKATLGKNSLEEVLNKFKDIIFPKTENILEKIF